MAPPRGTSGGIALTRSADDAGTCPAQCVGGSAPKQRRRVALLAAALLWWARTCVAANDEFAVAHATLYPKARQGFSGDQAALLRLRAPMASGTSRQDIFVLLSLAESMAGDKLSKALAALARIVRGLQPEDRLSLVTYGGPVARVDFNLETRAKERQLLEETEALRGYAAAQAAAVAPHSPATGLAEALRVLQPVVDAAASRDSVKRVILLSDGQPAPLEAAFAHVERLRAHGALTDVVALGEDHNEVLQSVADAGHGEFFFFQGWRDLPRIDQLAAAAGHRVFARGVTLALLPLSGVEQVRAHGRRRYGNGVEPGRPALVTAEGTVAVNSSGEPLQLGALREGQEFALLVDFRLPYAAAHRGSAPAHACAMWRTGECASGELSPSGARHAGSWNVGGLTEWLDYRLTFTLGDSTSRMQTGRVSSEVVPEPALRAGHPPTAGTARSSGSDAGGAGHPPDLGVASLRSLRRLEARHEALQALAAASPGAEGLQAPEAKRLERELNKELAVLVREAREAERADPSLKVLGTAAAAGALQARVRGATSRRGLYAASQKLPS